MADTPQDDEDRPLLVDKVKIGHEPLGHAERERLKRLRNMSARGSGEMIHRINQMGGHVDVGVQGLTHFRQFLAAIGLITEDQLLVAEVTWEATLHGMLRDSLQQVAKQQQQLVTPPSGLIVPPGRG